MDIFVRVVLIGIGATLVMDLWGVLLKKFLGVTSLSYAMVGRWLGHMSAGTFKHANIAAAPAVSGEKVIGWTAHYMIGVLFAVLLVAVTGSEWIHQPTPGPALAIGIATLVAPFFVMQPGMGFGVAAARTPKPNAARLKSLATHIIFGFGLYGVAEFLAVFVR